MRSPSLSHFLDVILAVPVQYKTIGIVMLPVLILGLTLDYWITTGLSYFVMDQRVQAAMANGSRSVLLMTFLAAAASIVFAYLMVFLLTRPLADLRQMAEDVSTGLFGFTSSRTVEPRFDPYTCGRVVIGPAIRRVCSARKQRTAMCRAQSSLGGSDFSRQA